MNKPKEMELKLNLDYADILELIKQLPTDQIIQLKSDLENQLQKGKTPPKSKSIQSLLLEGPTIDADQYETFLENRKHFGLWRAN